MLRLIGCAAGVLFVAGTAWADGFTPGNWTNVGSHHLLGNPDNVLLTYDYTGPDFMVGTFEWTGNGRVFGTSHPNETFCWITAPSGKSAGFQLSTQYLVEEFTSSGLSEYFNGTQAVGTWMFEFCESYDDYSPDPDAIHYNIQFTFNDDYVPAPAFPTRETFDHGIPDDWTRADYNGNGDWQLNSFFLRDNYTGGNGTCAMMDSDWYGLVYVDSGLISPPFTVPLNDAALEFDHDFNWLQDIYEEVGDVDIYTEAGGWVNLARYEYADFSGHVSIDLSAYAGQEAQIRFHYWFAYNQLWWQVDNVAITPVPGDLDDDDDVDGADFGLFVDCLLGPDVAYPTGCDDANLDGDTDVDLADFAAFQTAFTGPLP